jgi:hypothetical protein
LAASLIRSTCCCRRAAVWRHSPPTE